MNGGDGMRTFLLMATATVVATEAFAPERPFPDPWNYPGDDATTAVWKTKDARGLQWRVRGPLGRIPELSDVAWRWQIENRNADELRLLLIAYLGQRPVGYNHAFRQLWQTQDSLVHFLGWVTGKGRLVWNDSTHLVLTTSDGTVREATVLWGVYKCVPPVLDCVVFKLDAIDQPLEELAHAEGRDSGFFFAASFPRFLVPAGGWSVRTVRGIAIIRKQE